MPWLSGTTAKLDALKWRCIGPPRGGRVVAVAGNPKDRGIFYFGACAGGVWKTVDGGVYWRCVSDGFFGSAAIGALAVSGSDPDVLYAGCGETTTGTNGYVLRTGDHGANWEALKLPVQPNATIWGLSTHPADANRILAFSLFGEVYVSDDAGESWRKIAREFGEIRTAVWLPN